MSIYHINQLEYDRLKTGVDVAFNNNVNKIVKKSYNKTIDIQFGVYTGEYYEGYLTLDFKATNGIKDWLLDALCFGVKAKKHLKKWNSRLLNCVNEDEVWHYGFLIEIRKYFPSVIELIETTPVLSEASKQGIILAGRSKGGAEASLISSIMALLFKSEVICVGVESPPHYNQNSFRKREEDLGVYNIWTTCWHNDIVPTCFPWFVQDKLTLQMGERKNNLSIKDHITSTTKEEVIYKGLNEALVGVKK